MNNLQLATLILPAVALLLLILFYWLLQKKASNKTPLKHFSITILILAFILNFAWEVIQIPLFKDASFNIKHIAFCTLASVADAIMVLLIYLGFALIYNNQFWVQGLTLLRILILMLVGGLGAIAVEIILLSSGTWAYNTSMQIIPIVNVGLSPVLQFMVLPVCIYYLSFKMKSYGQPAITRK